ncbi:uncharacterized protein LOC134671590 [Cydia fagiglandana]|uniref:uncharacterized protein LOC134671590 n=1 Tax=Cydia fagiglandana TaxID=1458189 RepID=UPI002FEE49B4
MALEEYDYVVEYVKGKDNVAADALSRIRITSEELKEMNEHVINVMTRAQKRRMDAVSPVDMVSTDDRSLDNCVGVRTQYDLEPEPRSPGTDGAIVAGVLSPALEPHARWYLRELIRHSKFYHLFWPSQLNKTGMYSSRNIMSLAGRMVPIVPYRHPVPNITGIKYLDKVRDS